MLKLSKKNKKTLTIYSFCIIVIRSGYKLKGVNAFMNQIYWVWLTTLPNITAEKITALLECFDDAKEIYDADEQIINNVTILSRAEKNTLLNKDLKTANTVIERTNLAGAKIVTYEDINYPDMLRRIAVPPYVLYVKGKILEWDRLLSLGVIGTRKYTEYGKKATVDICLEIAREGITIVSGMARGIDSFAAIAALKAGGQTIAVLGSGIDVVYPPENDKLMEAIAKNGAVITEYPPGSRPLGSHFPVRNRIISGLSQGVLVVEAPIKSGTMITANYAWDMGRDLFAVPGHIYQENSKGTNKLIQQGAKITLSAQDILEEYRMQLPLLKKNTAKDGVDVEYECHEQAEKREQTPKQTTVKINTVKQVSIDDQRYSTLDDMEKKIIAMLIEKNLNIDDIVRNVEQDISGVTAKLIMLEMRGMIVKLPGNNYRLMV